MDQDKEASPHPNSWQKLWQDQHTPWDLGRPHKLTPELLQLAANQKVLPKAGTVYIPAAGRAHDATEFLQRGYYVIASDIVPEALQAAKELYGQHKNLDLLVENMLECPPERLNSCQIVFDRASMCAIHPSLRSKYLESMAARLGENGIFISILFLKVNKSSADGPPYAISIEEIQQTFLSHFEIAALETRHDGDWNETIRSELLLVALKK